MSIESSGVDCTAHTVIAGPRAWLRLDGLVLLGLGIGLFFTTDQPWWLIPVVILLPDLFMVGYLGGTRLGAAAYNAGHSYFLPAIVSVIAVWSHSSLGLALGLLWFAHIGMDRAMGYGLKYSDSFAHTHLGAIGRHRKG